MTGFVRYRNLSSEMNFIKKKVFYAMFFNSSMIAIFATTNFESPPLSWFFPGVYVNINSYWFTDVGESIVSGMIINMFVPLVIFLIKKFIHYYNVIKD